MQGLKKGRENSDVEIIFFRVDKRREENKNTLRGSLTNYVGNILAFFDHLPTCVDIFYGINQS